MGRKVNTNFCIQNLGMVFGSGDAGSLDFDAASVMRRLLV